VRARERVEWWQKYYKWKMRVICVVSFLGLCHREIVVGILHCPDDGIVAYSNKMIVV
jgi:hypothetical protein